MHRGHVTSRTDGAASSKVFGLAEFTMMIRSCVLEGDLVPTDVAALMYYEAIKV